MWLNDRAAADGLDRSEAAEVVVSPLDTEFSPGAELGTPGVHAEIATTKPLSVTMG